MTVYKLRTPISEEDARKLKVNDTIYITGTIFTARDEAHHRALEFHKEGKEIPLDLQGLAVFHCGPIVKKKDDKWIIVAAGPTTSTRMDLFEDEFIRNFNVRVVIGKGGMGRKTTDAMKKYGAVYGAFTGGAAVLAAKAVKNVKSVEWHDLGMPEAMWVLNVEDFGPLTVAIDTYGNNLFEDIRKSVEETRQKIYEKLSV
ncbi:MAG: fumarate hydratase C-terminal domain-containing protein [Candidatus Bathyarchaeota archaeon]|nr:MAG: fumarate hydratase C-terminal domain-containing protein [Candidatus Bathyarchaeota archaeon]